MEQELGLFTTEPKDEFTTLLRSTKRKGIEEVINNLEALGFFEAPASTRFHLNKEGGLLEHSLSVCKVALDLASLMINKNPALASKIPNESIIIAALLHDVCKADIYKKTMKWRKDARNQWEQYEAYDVDYSNFPLGHGEKSVMMLLRFGLELTDDEIVAIRWHMHAWDLPQSSEGKNCYNIAVSQSPLLAIIQSADGLSSHLLEE